MAERKYGIDLNLDQNQIKNAVAHRLTTTERGTLGGTLTASQGGLFVFDTTDSKFYVWNGTAWVDATQVVNSPLTIRGEISNANTNPSFPASPSVGDVWIIITNSGTVGGTAVDVGDQLIYSTSGWFVFQANLTDATTTVKGYIRLATQTEVNTGSDNTTAITPLTLKTNLDTNRGKIYRQTVATLTANTPLTITHNLALTDPLDYQLQVNTATGELVVDHIGVTSNTLTIETKKTYTSLRVVVVGL